MGEQLLIWQARASRVRTERPYGITPAYYHACAARATLDAYRPSRRVHPHETLADPGVTPPLPPDPACDALLTSMGVRERQKLGAVPYALIASWQDALAHPRMAAQFASPIGFAVAQMQRGHPPPSTADGKAGVSLHLHRVPYSVDELLNTYKSSDRPHP